jgi:hypothetical protein
MSENVNTMIQNGFRPVNLPPKNQDEKLRHLAHVESVLGIPTTSSAAAAYWARDEERRALDALWRSELITGKELVLTEQMKRLWTEYGLPSSFVRSIIWPWRSGKSVYHQNKTFTASCGDYRKLIELDLKRTLPFLGIYEDQASFDKCMYVLEKFASEYPHIGYTQGMSYICTRIMIEISFDVRKTFDCLRKIVVDSHTVACMYRLNLEEIRGTIEFLVDSIAWDNIPSLWLSLKKLQF